MLPVTHGPKYTQLQILLYTLVLFAGCLLPVIFGMSGWLYFAVAIVTELRRGLAHALQNAQRGVVAAHGIH